METPPYANAYDSGAQDIPLLATKLYIPRVRPDLVPRPRLTNQLDEFIRRKLTLVSAPAGFGKTCLLSEWLIQSDVPAAWVSLDEGDNDLARFLSYVIAALQTVEPGLGEATLAKLKSGKLDFGEVEEDELEDEYEEEDADELFEDEADFDVEEE